jgi:hypothetical protein
LTVEYHFAKRARLLLPEAGCLTTQARSSVGEHYLDTVGVSGSIPLVPTKTRDQIRQFFLQHGKE